MKQPQLLRTILFVFLLAVIAFIPNGVTTHAAEHPPLEYTFEEDPGVQFNGIDGMKRMKITIPNKQLLISDILMGENVYVQHEEEKINIINPIQIEEDTVMISFKNIEYLNLMDPNLDYEVVIEQSANLHFDQTETYRLPFKLYEVLPGFESVFIKSPAEVVNRQILKNNSYRDVYVHVPKMYLTGIETIHRYKGLVDPAIESHSMTNMDVFADPDASRLKVSVNDEEQYARDLAYNSTVKGFSIGQAGLEALVCETENDCEGSAKNFNLRAFNKYGKLLSARNFKVRVLNPIDGFKVNDYIAKPDKIFGQRTTVYELMSDPKMLQAIASQMPVTELDTLGIVYSLGSVAEVANHEQLKMALLNPGIKTVKLTAAIPEDVTIERGVTIDGDGNDFLGQVTIQSAGSTVRLKNTTVERDLIATGDADSFTILENVVVNGSTEVTDGSLHLFNFNSYNDIVLDGEDMKRVVSVESIPSLSVKTDAEITLVGAFEDVTIEQIDAHLTLTHSTEIERIKIDDPNHLTLKKMRDKEMPEQIGNGTITIVDLDPPVGDGGQMIQEWYYPEMLAQSSKVWEEIGVKLTLDQAPSQVDWKVMNPKVFGNQSEVLLKNGILYVVDVTAEQTKEIVLQGTHDDKLYRVTILAEVEIQY